MLLVCLEQTSALTIVVGQPRIRDRAIRELPGLALRVYRRNEKLEGTEPYIREAGTLISSYCYKGIEIGRGRGDEGCKFKFEGFSG